MKLSFVIPCYRSEKTIEGVVSEIKSVVATRPGTDYEIIMVSDHSPDNVYSVIERMCKADPAHLKGVEFARNFGQPSALMAGFARASGEIVFSCDDDGQAPVDAIFALVDKLTGGPYDVVYGTYPVKRHGLLRNLGSDINHWMSVWLIGKPKNVRASSFFAAKRFIIREMLNYSGPYPYLGGLIFRATRAIGTVDVNHRERADGTSGYSLAKLVGLWLNGFTAFSVKPLRLASWAGGFCALFGFGYGVWTVLRKLFLHDNILLGYSSMMSVMLFIGGMLMLMLGLIGEYLGRIYICINRSPQYVIARETDSCGISHEAGK